MSDYEDRAEAYRKAWRDKYTYRQTCANRVKGSKPVLNRRGKEKGWEWIETFYLSCQASGALDTVFQKYESLKTMADQNAAAAVISQVEAGLEELYRLARTVNSNDLAEADIIKLGGNLAALVDMVQERELIMRSVDVASLTRTAEALQADLDNARSVLQKADIEWKLDVASQEAAVTA